MTMTVTQALLDSYRSGLDAYGQAAATYVEQFIAMVMAEDPTLTVADLREITIEAIQDALNIFGDQASELALSLFEHIMGEDYSLEIVDVIDPGMVDEKVRFFARDLVEGNTASFTRNVTDLTSYYVKRSAYENMVENCWRNDVRWARVPSGRETCSFCFMLSSRGFVYGSERKASQKKEGGAYHQNCDCIATPGFEGLDPDTQVEGYQPSEMYERLEACATTIGEKANATGEDARKRIRAEIDTRNWKWLYTGEVPGTTVEQGAKPKKKEEELASILNRNGFAVGFLKPSNTSGHRTADATLNGIRWEFKQPTGNAATHTIGKNTIDHQFEAAVGQSRNLVIDATIIEHYEGISFDSICEKAETLLAGKWSDEFDQVLVVGSDRIRRYKNA